jgi:uncharacterized membrane protein YhdT
VAGTGILLVALLAAFGNIVVLDGLVTEGDAARTATDILASEGTFRLGVGALYLVVVLDVVVAWALARYLSPVHAGLARLAGWFRLAYAAVFLVALSQLAGIPRLLAGDGYGDAFTPAHLQGEALMHVEAFHDTFFAGLVLFGVHLVLVGHLVWRSGTMPRLLGVLLVVAGSGYVFDTVAALLVPEPSFVVSNVTFLGEFLLALWLVVRSRSVEVGTVRHAI